MSEEENVLGHSQRLQQFIEIAINSLSFDDFAVFLTAFLRTPIVRVLFAASLHHSRRHRLIAARARDMASQSELITDKGLLWFTSGLFDLVYDGLMSFKANQSLMLSWVHVDIPLRNTQISGIQRLG
ncbi:hypothetical protein [Oceanobacter antarcticus]|uniref:Uncharacterized protein n=1 Tax=Oceanobacter antarcticus TaxID=3133425 RepID=A0ABW8NJQ6_9GAMM